MIAGQTILEINNSPICIEGQSKKAVLAQTYMNVFFMRCDHLADRLGP
jgi:hypothetical protein